MQIHLLNNQEYKKRLLSDLLWSHDHDEEEQPRLSHALVEQQPQLGCGHPESIQHNGRLVNSIMNE